MHEDSKIALKKIISSYLPVLQDQIDGYLEPYQVWSKLSDGKWKFEFQGRPNLQKLFKNTRKQLDERTKGFASQFLKHYPEYDGLVGLAGFSHQNIFCSDTHIPESAIKYLWFKHKTFNCDEASIDTVIGEFEDFIDNPKVRIHFESQLLNFKMVKDAFNLPENLTIRRLNDEEISAIHGGSLSTLGFKQNQLFGPHEFVIEGEIDVAKQVGNSWAPAPSGSEIIKNLLDKAILCLRTFKTGRVGYDYIHFKPVTFCPIGFFSQGCGDLYVPFGSYHISNEEEVSLSSYAEMFFEVSESSMDIACIRLADAENRTRPQDKLVDAVIGMEAILLAGLGKDDRRGELKYRFSLHYSTLFNSSEERFHAFQVAKDMYDLRSTIAHGSTLKNGQCRVGSEKCNLDVAATRATEALRLIIQRFLPQTKNAPYKNHKFWERSYFGLTLD